MKYIRTNDGRIFYAKKKNKKNVKLANDNLHWEAIPKGCDDYFTLDYSDDEILKEADTIEELCDEFVCDFGENKTKLHAYNLSIAKKTKATNIYGAIWTDKGLIYVAKMNDKGTLELL